MANARPELYITDLIGRVIGLLREYTGKSGRPSKYSTRPNLSRIAAACGIGRVDLRRMIRNGTLPTSTTADRILNALNLTVLDILNNEERNLLAAGATHLKGFKERIYTSHWANGMTERGIWDCPCGVCQSARAAGIDPGKIFLGSTNSVDTAESEE